MAGELYRMLRARSTGRILGGWSVAYIAARLRRPRRSIFRALARLERDGAIVRASTTRRGRGLGRNVYRVLEPTHPRRRLSVTPATCRMSQTARHTTRRLPAVPKSAASEVLTALSAAYPEAPPPARRAWVALVNRTPPGLLALVPYKIRELSRRTLLRCPRAVLYRWLVDQLTQLDVALPAFASRHQRAESQHWRGGLTWRDMDQQPPTPPSPATAAEVDAALSRIRALTDAATPQLTRQADLVAAMPDGLSRAEWLAELERRRGLRGRTRLDQLQRSPAEILAEAAARDMQTLDLARRYLQRRRQLSTQGAVHANPKHATENPEAEAGAAAGAGTAGPAGGPGA